MRLIIQDDRIVATATDAYEGPEQWMTAPESFDVVRMGEYRVDDGVTLTLRPVANAMPLRAITYLAFRRRFTHSERVGLELAALDDPTASEEKRLQSAGVRVYLVDASAAAWIDLDDVDTRTGVQYLESAGLIAQGRGVEILDSQVDYSERPVSAQNGKQPMA